MPIRKAEEKDIPEILSLLVEVDMTHHNGRPDLFKGPETKYSADELRSLFKDESRPVFVFVTDSKRVVGHAFCMVLDHTADRVLTDIKTMYIDDICVSEGMRGQHIGKSLYEYVKEYAKSIGCYNVTLNVWECNPAARKFYEAMGMSVQKTGMEAIL